MTSYPVDIRRCRHIRTNGTQCGSPALKNEEFCYYHKENRPLAASLYLDGDRYPDNHIMIPPFEDAHAIQSVLRHVVCLMMDRRIERKDAGLMLYALQIASGNLKRMEEEKPRPTEVVRDVETTGETPLGMTPWSKTGEGHDAEESEEMVGKIEACAERVERLPHVSLQRSGSGEGERLVDAEGERADGVSQKSSWRRQHRARVSKSARPGAPRHPSGAVTGVGVLRLRSAFASLRSG